MFIEEIIESYESTGEIQISSEWDVSSIRDLVFTAIANTNRFNGMTKFPYNLIQHSIFVSNYARDLYLIYKRANKDRLYWKIGLCGLVHDLGEVIVGDTIFPIKKRVNREYENKIEFAFINWFLRYCYDLDVDLTEDFYKSYIKEADSTAGILELIGVSKDYKFCAESFLEKAFDYEYNIDDYTKILEDCKKEYTSLSFV